MGLYDVLVEYGWRFLVGGGVVVLVTWLSDIDRPVLSGLAIVFPTITLTSYFLIGYLNGVEAIRSSIPASTVAIVGYLGLFPVMYFASYRFGLMGVLVLGFVAWLVITVLLFVAFGLSFG